jgi:hypothetical protein
LPDFVLQTEIDTYDHMGALITDAILQSGIKYNYVVKPRAERIQKDYPEAKTTSGFLNILLEKSPNKLLDFEGSKPLRVLEVTKFFHYEGIETVEQLRNWINISENRKRLMKIKGIKDKTADYFGILCGLDTNAVDRHLINFLKEAGIDFNGYEEVQQIINQAAEILDQPKAYFDHSIWKYMSERKNEENIMRKKVVSIVCKNQEVQDFYNLSIERINNIENELNDSKFIKFVEIKDGKEFIRIYNVNEISKITIWDM